MELFGLATPLLDCTNWSFVDDDLLLSSHGNKYEERERFEGSGDACLTFTADGCLLLCALPCVPALVSGESVRAEEETKRYEEQWVEEVSDGWKDIYYVRRCIEQENKEAEDEETLHGSEGRDEEKERSVVGVYDLEELCWLGGFTVPGKPVSQLSATSRGLLVTTECEESQVVLVCFRRNPQSAPIRDKDQTDPRK